MKTLFPLGLEERNWVNFNAEGFSLPVSGTIFRTATPACCGVPLGGISTGCIDIDGKGIYGLSSIFNPSSAFPYVKNGRMPRKLPDCQPILGLVVDDKPFVLATKEVINGGDIVVCTEHLYDLEPKYAETRRNSELKDIIAVPKLPDVQAAKEIHYWGHYPAVDMEYEIDAPIAVGLRAWSPFIPGDAPASNVPAAVFVVYLRNNSAEAHKGSIVINFPGPDSQEAMASEFTRKIVNEDFDGVMVSSLAGVQYILGVLGKETYRFGSGLNRAPLSWAKMANGLPQPAFREEAGVKLYADSSASASVDFSLAAGEEKVVQFLLTWYAPVLEGGRKVWDKRDDVIDGIIRHRWIGSEWTGNTHFYTKMYATRFSSALDVARWMVEKHEGLLKRILAWQQAIYDEKSLPDWVKDSLVNNLALITEDSHWFQAKSPIGDWAYPDGAFALDECPRGDPHYSCIPCDWYGNHPIVYFFPELARSTLRGFKAYQLESGEIAFSLGRIFDLPDMASPEFYWQVSLNGFCYIDMVDRLWQRTGDLKVLEEFYASVKSCNTFTMNLRTGPGGPISMPAIGGMEWFEHGEWAGMASHMGGLRLAELKIVERMAKEIGDKAYVEECQKWFAEGSRAMEEDMWTGEYYLNFWEKETGKKSEDVMAYQLDGEWTARYHGFAGVYRSDRVLKALEKIRQCNIALTPEVGAANFAHADGSALKSTAEGGSGQNDQSDVAWYGAFAMFPPEVLMLAMTYIYAGKSGFGLDLARKHWETLALKQCHAWDLPNIVRGDTGERVYGTDYSQDMMLWALPAALSGEDISTYCAKGHFIDRVITAGM